MPGLPSLLYIYLSVFCLLLCEHSCICAHVHTCTCVTAQVWRSKASLAGMSSPSTTWVSGTDLRSLGLVTGALSPIELSVMIQCRLCLVSSRSAAVLGGILAFVPLGMALGDLDIAQNLSFASWFLGQSGAPFNHSGTFKTAVGGEVLTTPRKELFWRNPGCCTFSMFFSPLEHFRLSLGMVLTPYARGPQPS